MTETKSKKSRGRPKTGKTKKKASRTMAPKKILEPEIMGPDDSEILEELDVAPIDLKSALTEKEMRFIELRLSGNYSIETAMILAGYEQYSQNHRYFLAKKIIEKFENQVGDHRKLMQKMGLGPARIIEGIANLALNADSEVVRLSAWVNLGKYLGLHDSQEEQAPGIAINILRSASPAKVLGTGHGAGGPKPKTLPAPQQITK